MSTSDLIIPATANCRGDPQARTAIAGDEPAGAGARTAACDPAFTAPVGAGEDHIQQEVMSAVTPPTQKPGDESGLREAERITPSRHGLGLGLG